MAKILAKFAKSEAFVGSAHSAETIKTKGLTSESPAGYRGEALLSGERGHSAFSSANQSEVRVASRYKHSRCFVPRSAVAPAQVSAQRAPHEANTEVAACLKGKRKSFYTLKMSMD